MQMAFNKNREVRSFNNSRKIDGQHSQQQNLN